MTTMTRTAYGFETGRDDQVWRRQAACRRYPADWWTSPNIGERSQAIWVCLHCPVKPDCGAWARANRQLCDGAVYGGLYYVRDGSGRVRRSAWQPRPIRPAEVYR